MRGRKVDCQGGTLIQADHQSCALEKAALGLCVGAYDHLRTGNRRRRISKVRLGPSVGRDGLDTPEIEELDRQSPIDRGVALAQLISARKPFSH